MPKKWSEVVAKHSKLTSSEREDVRREIEESVARMKLDELRRARHLSQEQLALRWYEDHRRNRPARAFRSASFRRPQRYCVQAQYRHRAHVA